MELIPTQDEVLALLRSTGGLRSGYFEFPNGLRTTEYLQVALTMCDFKAANILSVALSRKLRANSDIRAILPKLSVVAPATGGLPVAFGVAEALHARRVFWAEHDRPAEPLHLRQFLELEPGEKVVLVDDIIRTGSKLAQTKAVIEAAGGEVVALGVIVEQRAPGSADFSPLPFYSLAKLDMSYIDPREGDRLGIPLTKVWL